MLTRKRMLARLIVASPQSDALSGSSTMHHTEIDQAAREFYDHLQKQGIPVDLTHLTHLRDQAQQDLDSALDYLESIIGFRPNPHRPDDYAKVAKAAGHELPKSPAGRYKTDEYTIERFAKKVPVLAQMQEARRIRGKLSLLNSIRESTFNGRIYPEYKMDPELGRTHSGGSANPMNWKPEFQGIVKSPDHYIMVVDYSRIEPRVLATLSQDKQLQEDLKTDPYRALATTVFNTQNITPEQRNIAKVAFLAMIYDTDARGLASKLKIKEGQAEKIIQAWHTRYPQASAYRESLRQQGTQTGKATSYHGRTKTLNHADPEANGRLAINSVIQNTGGDLARIGFTNVHRNEELKAKQVQPLTTVHDALVLAVPKHVDPDEVKSLIRKDMVDNNDPRFNLEVGFKHGDSWGSVK